MKNEKWKIENEECGAVPIQMNEIKRDGMLLIDKESGITSHDVVDLVRRCGKVKKAGHTGTLDPLATGLLVLCIGKATRLQSYLMNMTKSYEGEIQFGFATDTYDAAGTATSEPVEMNLSSGDLEPFLEKLRGEIDQVPPPYSAKKVQGVRSYELARKGEAAPLTPKRVTIYDLQILSVDGSVLTLRVRCSAGTYVRSIAHDLGQSLGGGAHLKSLRRTAIGDFHISDALASDRIRSSTPDEIFARPQYLQLSEVSLPIAAVVIDPMQERKLLQGQTVIVKPQSSGIRQNDLVSVSNLSDELVAIAQAVEVLREGGGPVALQPKVVLKE
jgi:tRNA pseudouridine55 synthase